MEAKDDDSVRVCSLGCGDGQLDRMIILKVLEKYPEATIEIVGVDINEQSCRIANENFASLAGEHGHLKYNVLNFDILDINPQEQGRFDVVVIVHTLYFLKNPEDVLKKCQELKSLRGGRCLAFDNYCRFNSNVDTTYLYLIFGKLFLK